MKGYLVLLIFIGFAPFCSHAQTPPEVEEGIFDSSESLSPEEESESPNSNLDQVEGNDDAEFADLLEEDENSGDDEDSDFFDSDEDSQEVLSAEDSSEDDLDDEFSQSGTDLEANNKSKLKKAQRRRALLMRSTPSGTFDLKAVRRRNPGKEQKVPHPLAPRGLKRITKDNVYVYRRKESKREYTSTILISQFAPENFEGNSIDDSGASPQFADIYENAFVLTVDYEKTPFKAGRS